MRDAAGSSPDAVADGSYLVGDPEALIGQILSQREACDAGVLIVRPELGATTMDDVAARTLFERAAAQGHAGALERMGAFAQGGRGGPQDSKAAKAYYEQAATLGNEDAKAALKRAQCPIVIKDKSGKFVGNLCF